MTQSVRKEKKTVRFADETDNTCHLVQPLSLLPEVRHHVWYHPKELKVIKKEALQACRDAQRFGLAGLLTEIYGCDTPETQDRLNYWTRMSSSVRGLERFTNEELNIHRSKSRKRAILSVLHAQQELQKEQGIDTAIVLRKFAEAFTEDSRMFAQKMGQADEHALMYIENKAETDVRPSLKLLGEAKRQSDRRLKAMTEHSRKQSDRRLQNKEGSGSLRNAKHALAMPVQWSLISRQSVASSYN